MLIPRAAEHRTEQARFLSTTEARGATFSSVTHPLAGPDGGELRTDVARFGAPVGQAWSRAYSSPEMAPFVAETLAAAKRAGARRTMFFCFAEPPDPTAENGVWPLVPDLWTLRTPQTIGILAFARADRVPYRLFPAGA